MLTLAMDAGAIFPSHSKVGIGGSVVECSPATRAARVRFPADASVFVTQLHLKGTTLAVKAQWMPPSFILSFEGYHAFVTPPLLLMPSILLY